MLIFLMTKRVQVKKRISSSQEQQEGASSCSASSSTNRRSPAEVFYRNNKMIKTLVILSVGLSKEDFGGDDVLINFEESPWSDLKKHQKGGLKPNNENLCSEVIQRWDTNTFCVKEKLDDTGKVISVPPPFAPRPSAWKKNKVVEWLSDYPIGTRKDNLEFLKREILYEKTLAEDLVQAENAEKEMLGKNWVGMYPMLRLMHTSITDDDLIKRAYIVRETNPPERLHLENRNSIQREASVWELVANKFNDP